MVIDIIQEYSSTHCLQIISLHIQGGVVETWQPNESLCIMIMMSSTKMSWSSVTIWNKAVFFEISSVYYSNKRCITTIMIKYYVSSSMAAAYEHEGIINNTSISYCIWSFHLIIVVSKNVIIIWCSRKFWKCNAVVKLHCMPVRINQCITSRLITVVRCKW